MDDEDAKLSLMVFCRAIRAESKIERMPSITKIELMPLFIKSRLRVMMLKLYSVAVRTRKAAPAIAIVELCQNPLKVFKRDSSHS